jgi:hypothetical protein
MDFDSAAIAEYPSRESYLTMGADPEYIDRPWSNRAPTARNGVFGPGQ